MTWLEQWNKYVEKRKAEFSGAGIVWPEVPLINGQLSEIVCGAIMEQSKKGK